MVVTRIRISWPRIYLSSCLLLAAIAPAQTPSAQEDLAACRVHRVTTLPGSHNFAADFIEATAQDPADDNPDHLWALTADLSEAVPPAERAMYIARSADGGATWTEAARIPPQYFDERIGEGLRNGFVVATGGESFILTTQLGAFEVVPQPGQPSAAAQIKPIAGPHVPATPPRVPIPKRPGDPIRANIASMTSDGATLYLGYGYFDRNPQLFSYRRNTKGNWVEDSEINGLPTDMDLLSSAFDEPKNPHPGFLYVGTGDQAYLLNLHASSPSARWSRIDGVGPDSAIHGMSVVGGLRIAACWGVYNPIGPGMVRRVTNATFLLHRASDEAGPNLRAYSIDADPRRPERVVVTSLTGVYASSDGGQRWRRLNDLPDGEYRTAHFASDGSVLVSGMPGTFLVNPFSQACIPQLKRRR